MHGWFTGRVDFEIDYRPLPLDQAVVRYIHGPDSRERPGVDRGTTTELELDDSTLFPGTTRKVWVHVPARYDAKRPANLAIFQDGWWYLDPEGEVRGAIVIDNLVDREEIPVTLGVFVDPGVFLDQPGSKNRNTEYDAFDDRYVRFLLSEVLAVVSARWSISDRPEHRLLCGGSSGGNCAFTAAWLRPDMFGHVISCLSSFAQMPGGNPYPHLIQTTPPKPLKVFMQAAHRDLNWNEPDMNWLSNNLRVAAALAEAGYDLRLVLGDGAHSPNHGGVILPDAFRWHWGAPQPAC